MLEACKKLLRAATTPDGILASPTNVTNYRRVWARDSVMCGLAGVAMGDEVVVQGLKGTLDTLAREQGPDGQIPSNVSMHDGEVGDVSYGGLSGRVDAIPWFIIGLAHYVDATGDARYAASMKGTVWRGLEVMTAWEYNRRGLVVVPLGGDWADEYVLHGYVLFDQLMRIWALRCARRLDLAPQSVARLTEIEERVVATYRLDVGGAAADGVYHPHAAEQVVADDTVPPYWLPALSPGGYQRPFDAFSNALAVLLGLGTADTTRRTLDAGETIRRKRPADLIPAFWPPIQEGDPEWHLLVGNHRGRFQNEPGRYHNGGLWPMVNGWWGCALAEAGRPEAAEDLLDALHRANRTVTSDPEADGVDGPSRDAAARGWDGDGWTFPEFLDAETGRAGGTMPLTWSAAAPALLDAHRRGESLFYGETA